MPDARVTKIVDGYLIVRSGSRQCPSSDLCDAKWGKAVRDGESYDDFVRRHCKDHNLGEFQSLDDAERNLGLWCFYFDHKYVWGNPELHPLPHWEMHAFVSEWDWNEEDLQQRTPLSRRKLTTYLPEWKKRKRSEYRRFKQCEVPRQCQKTSIGARAYSVHRSKYEYFLNDRGNYRIIIRSATTKNTRDTLAIIRRMSSKQDKIARLYGVWLVRCGKCGFNKHLPERVTSCPNIVHGKDGEQACGATTGLRHKRLSLITDTQGSGATGHDQISFRWLTDAEKADSVAAYSIWVAGLKTETTGQRPDLYIWDDPQTEDNSNTVEKRAAITAQFEGSWRELQFGGEMLVFDTRKYMGDFASKIQQEPLTSIFFSLRREVRWRTDEPDDAPYVVGGWRYYYPVKGNGEPALDAKEVAQLKKQKNFSAEYMNDPLDEESSTFKRSDFIIVSRSENSRDWPEWQTAPLPVEIVAGLGGLAITSDQQRQMDRANVRINAMNAFDPADAKKADSDKTFGVAVRLDRYGKIYVTGLTAGRWAAKRRWSEVAKLSAHNRARFTDYEMGTEEDDIQASFEKWVRDRSDEVFAATGEIVTERPPIKWSKMPKSGKDGRINETEAFMPIYVLDDAGSEEVIEEFIAQYVGLGVEDHDDGPDAFSRLTPYYNATRRKAPEEPKTTEPITHGDDGSAFVPLGHLKKLAGQNAGGGLWGEQGVPRCPTCNRTSCREVHVA